MTTPNTGRLFLSLAIISFVAVAMAQGGAATGTSAPAHPEGFSIETVTKPALCSDVAAVGKYAAVHYTGTIAPSSPVGMVGEQFDSSVGGQPFSFQVGAGQVIKGWDVGVEGMCVGEKRILTIPAVWAYGDSGAGSIPGGATLRFEVELLSVSESGSPEPDMFQLLDLDKDGRLSKEEVSKFLISELGVDGEDLTTTVAQIMDSDDRNKDGFITWEEFSGPKGGAPPTYASQGTGAAQTETASSTSAPASNEAAPKTEL